MKTHKNPDGTSDAWYVARKDVASNTLYIVQGHDLPWLLSTELSAGQMSWIAGNPPDAEHLAAKTRYRHADVACRQHTGINSFSLTRSEEHPLELQSLMRNSYAVFCLKKKKKQIQRIQISTTI